MFPERDCITMIRPLIDENGLQKLSKMNVEELRPEFVDQVTQLRWKVLNKVRPKMMNGMKLTGSMIFDLVVSYTEAINNGAVPNIQNAWTYICQTEN